MPVRGSPGPTAVSSREPTLSVWADRYTRATGRARPSLESRRDLRGCSLFDTEQAEAFHCGIIKADDPTIELTFDFGNPQIPAALWSC